MSNTSLEFDLRFIRIVIIKPYYVAKLKNIHNTRHCVYKHNEQIERCTNRMNRQEDDKQNEYIGRCTNRTNRQEDAQTE